MTTMTSTDVTSSDLKGLLASLFVPGDTTSRSDLDENTRSAVGQRKRSDRIRTGRSSKDELNRAGISEAPTREKVEL